MGRIKFLVSLTTNSNDYQIEQAKSAEEAAQRLDVDLRIIYADNDAINQSTQILKEIQAPEDARPGAIVFEPVGGTALPQVARAAARVGIGWAVLNRDADYIAELRGVTSAPILSVSSDHLEIGRIQGRQFAALLPDGGSILYIQGPSENFAAKDRTTGMLETKPANVQVIYLKGQWTEESAVRALRSWLKLSTSQKLNVGVMAAQNDAMAIGARKAFQEISNPAERDRWLMLPYTGCDGLPKTGQSWLRSGLLAATIFVPPNTDQAMSLIVDAIRNRKSPPQHALTVPKSIPSLDELVRRRA